MRFYCVTWYDESCPENTGGRYFRTKREAERCAAEQRREGKGHVENRYGDGVIESDTSGYVKIRTIELKGTCKEMVWQALHHQIVP